MNTFKNNIITYSILAVTIHLVAATVPIAQGQTLSNDSVSTIAAKASETQDSNTIQVDLVKEARKNYKHSLQSGNQGVVESAIYNLMILKLRYPDADLSTVDGELKELAITGDSKSVRLKAYLTLNYLDDYHWLEKNQELSELLTQGNQEKLFNILANDLTKNYLTSSTPSQDTQ